MKSVEPFAIVFLHNNTEYRIGVIPSSEMCDDVPNSFEIVIGNVFKGFIYFAHNKWTSYDIDDETLVQLLGKCIHEIYKKRDVVLEMCEENSFSLN